MTVAMRNDSPRKVTLKNLHVKNTKAAISLSPDITVESLGAKLQISITNNPV